MKIHSIERLREVFWYNPITGEIKWNVAVGTRIKRGSIAGSIGTSGYVRVAFDGASYAAHRLGWAIFKGRWPDLQIDHKDGNRSNNAIANLRECSCAENQQNKGVSKLNRSGFVGVSWNSRAGGWKATISAGGVSTNLGVYSTKEAAAKRYAEEKRRIHRFHPDAVTRYSGADCRASGAD